MSIDALFALTDTSDFEECGSLAVERATATGASVTLVLQVWPGGGNDAPQFWEVVCSDPLRYRLTPSGAYGCISLFQDHPLVWEHTDPTRTLGFLGKPDNALVVTGALIEQHYALAQDWIPVGRYLRLPPNGKGIREMGELLSGGHGFVAKGPERLVRACADVLRTHGLEPYFTPGHVDEQQTGVVSATGDDALRALIVNDHFVVGREFSARLLGEDAAATISVLSVVALTEPVPDKNLRRGQVGTVVAQVAFDAFEVEVSDGEGRVYARAALLAEQLMVLHHESTKSA